MGKTILVALTVCVAHTVAAHAAPPNPCRIEVIEKGSDWPVPLVELRTTGNQRFVTDNAGVIAIDQPELMGREVWFAVRGHGYEVPADGFGYRGVRLTPKPGKTLRVEVTRTTIAKRLGRLTGAGLFTHSQRLGGERTWRESGVVGADSVQVAVHNGKRFWLWGDTTLHHYPLGIFHSSSATTARKPIAAFKPPIRLSFDYFRDKKTGRPRGVAKLPGTGPTWLSAYVSLPDKSGKHRLVATYMKIKPPLEAYEWGLCVWDDAAERFDRHKVIWTKSDTSRNPPPLPKGHPVLWTDKSGKRWVLFGDPLPTLRCPATFEAWQDPSAWETIEPQKTFRAANDGRAVHPHRSTHSGSVAWHPWRQKWVTVFMEKFGQPSAFGELWYAEADAPTGPWGPAVKVLSHDNYTFYNPRIHADWSSPDSPALIFEGTYTAQFANKPEPTPGYDYNQVLYRLDLDDERLKAAR